MEYHFNSSFLANSYSYGLSCGYDVAIVLSIWRDSMTKRERHIRWTRREQAFVVVDLALCFFLFAYELGHGYLRSMNLLARWGNGGKCLCLPVSSRIALFLFSSQWTRTGRDSSNFITIWSYVAVLSRLWIYCGYTYVSQRNNRGPGKDECLTLC